MQYSLKISEYGEQLHVTWNYQSGCLPDLAGLFVALHDSSHAVPGARCGVSGWCFLNVDPFPMLLATRRAGVREPQQDWGCQTH